MGRPGQAPRSTGARRQAPEQPKVPRRHVTIGTVTLFDAPNRVAFTWQDPNWAGPTTVDVTFTSVPEGTLVQLQHHGWEAAGVSNATAANFDQGWGFILKLFAQAQG